MFCNTAAVYRVYYWSALSDVCRFWADINAQSFDKIGYSHGQDANKETKVLLGVSLFVLSPPFVLGSNVEACL